MDLCFFLLIVIPTISERVPRLMFIYFDQTDSTNYVAKEMAYSGSPSGTVIWAGIQSSGRGQYDRSFASPAGGLYFSLLLHPDLPLHRLPLITLATGLACREVLAATCNVAAQIKWPNDLYVGSRKIAGILCEQVTIDQDGRQQPCAIIGVGMNINSTVADFPPELQTVVTTVHDLVGSGMELQPLLTRLVEAITAHIHLLRSEPSLVLARWQKYDYLYKQPLTYLSGSTMLVGTGQGITAHGLYRFIDTMGNEHTIVGGQLRPRNRERGRAGC